MHVHFPDLQIARDKLVSLGTPVGKLTHSGKFRLTIGALELLSRYAKHKVGLACLRLLQLLRSARHSHGACTAYWCDTGLLSWDQVGLYSRCETHYLYTIRLVVCCLL
jgi:hypothetical protein